jgi:hypothetical protein
MNSMTLNEPPLLIPFIRFGSHPVLDIVVGNEVNLFISEVEELAQNTVDLVNYRLTCSVVESLDPQSALGHEARAIGQAPQVLGLGDHLKTGQ